MKVREMALRFIGAFGVGRLLYGSWALLFLLAGGCVADNEESSQVQREGEPRVEAASSEILSTDVPDACWPSPSVEEEPPYDEEPEVEIPPIPVPAEPLFCAAHDRDPLSVKPMVIKSDCCCTMRSTFSDGFCWIPSPWGGERYAPHEEIGFLNPRSEPLSTFALDVDTTSYALMRRDLTESERLPSPWSVWVEEYVNYFSYDYPQPKDGEPVAVTCELAACPWNATNRLLRVGVQAKRIEQDAVPPCNLTFLVDVSGSMRGADRIDLLKEALKQLVDRLRDEDHVAIVTYADSAFVALPSVSGGEKQWISSVIDGLSACGGTAGGDGIQRAYAEAEKNFDPEANNRVILVTDGDFNVGIRSPKQLRSFIADKRESGVFLTVLGVGRGNFNDAGMKALANAGNGNYAYLDSPEEARRVLLDEFSGTLVTVAKDVKVQLAFDLSEIRGYRLLGYENRLLTARDFKDDGKDAGEIGAGHSMTAFYEIVPAGTGALFTVQTRYKLPNADESVLREQTYTAAELTRTEPSEDFRFASAVAEFALLVKDSKFRGTASFTNLIARARGATGADRDGRRAEFVRLAEQAAPLVKERDKLAVENGLIDAQIESAVRDALRALKHEQASDGSWGTNKVADTAWTVLAFLVHGELPVSSLSKEFGESVQKGCEFLIDTVLDGAVDEVSESDLALAAYALVMIYERTRYPGASSAAVKLFGRMLREKDEDPRKQLLRIEACRQAQGSVHSDLSAMAGGLMPELMSWWKMRDAKDDEIAFKCRALMLSDKEPTDEVFWLLDAMRDWKGDDARPHPVSLCATLCKYVAGVRADARSEDLQAWTEWDTVLKRYLKERLANAVDVSAKALIILQLTAPYRYWHTMQAPSKHVRPSAVQVEVDI